MVDWTLLCIAIGKKQDCWQRFSTAGEMTFYLSSYRSKHADGLLLFQDSVAEINQ